MHIRQRRSNALDVLLASVPVPVEILLKQGVHHHQLGNFSGDRAELEGAFVGAAAQHYIRQLGGRRF